MKRRNNDSGPKGPRPPILAVGQYVVVLLADDDIQSGKIVSLGSAIDIKYLDPNKSETIDSLRMSRVLRLGDYVRILKEHIEDEYVDENPDRDFEDKYALVHIDGIVGIVDKK